jgi:O-methyltransferase involved in polyketide biosynthesis
LAVVVITDSVGGANVQSFLRKHLIRSSIASPAATDEEATVNPPATGRFAMESIDFIDKGCRPDEEISGFPTVAEQIAPDLAGVSETMLWSLHHRASEAARSDGVLVDPDSVRIQSALNYDFTRHFGDPLGSLAARAAEIDRMLRSWLEGHPEGIVVSLGEGLETQGRRVDNGRMRWLSVDLPDAIRLRERFLAPTARFRHIAASALDPVWMDAVDPSSGVFIVAQGLLMYFTPERVRQLFVSIADRFPGSEFVFDVIPRWFSDLTLLGLNQTASYRLPSMPWGINRDEVEPTLRRWHPSCGYRLVPFLPKSARYTAPGRGNDKPDAGRSPRGSQPRACHDSKRCWPIDHDHGHC